MKIYWKILISYLCVCMVPLLLSLFTCLKLEQNVRETILRDQSRMIDDVWNNLNATIQASYEAERMIAEDAVLKGVNSFISIRTCGLGAFQTYTILRVTRASGWKGMKAKRKGLLPAFHRQ